MPVAAVAVVVCGCVTHIHILKVCARREV